MAAKVQSLRRYTPEEDKLILENWWDPERRAMVVEKLGRPREGINFRYYALLRKLGKDPSRHRAEMLLRAQQQESGTQAPSDAEPSSPATLSATPHKPQPIVVQHPASGPKTDGASGDETVYVFPGDLYAQVEALQKAVESMQKDTLEFRRSFGAWLVTIGEAYQHGMTTVDVVKLVEENDRLREELTKLKSYIDQKDAYYDDITRQLNFWLGQFMRLSSLQKVASLEDFIPRLKTIIERFGVVTNATIEVPAFQDPPPRATAAP